ncbi:MAG TPA: hypothetical protein VMV45_21495 [Casimicrobiaceae bacterium]|nr:hypothetical protein [Casimicrobiaceae bacterium]
MRPWLVLVAVLLAVCCPTLASASCTSSTYCSDIGVKSVTVSGVNNIPSAPNQNRAYFGWSEALQSDATRSGCVQFVFDVTTATGKALQAQLLMAKVTGRNVSRIDYDPTNKPFCVLVLLEVS